MTLPAPPETNKRDDINMTLCLRSVHYFLTKFLFLGTCEWNKNQKEAVCNCQKGYTGAQCDSCADTNSNFPDCYIVTTTVTPGCYCDPRGVLEGSDLCSDVCHCKVSIPIIFLIIVFIQINVMMR